MTSFWFVFGFFRELFFSSQNEKMLEVRQAYNRSRVLSRLQNYTFYKNLNISEWDQIPVMTKQSYLSHFEKLNIKNLDLNLVAQFSQKMEQTQNHKQKFDGFTVGLSTGTSGTRGAFILGNREIGLWSGSILAKAFGWNIFKPQKIAFVFRTNGPLYEGINRGWIRMRFFDINQSAATIDNELKQWQPTVLISVPYFFSKYISRNFELAIHPKKVFSCADVLDPEERKKIEDYFSVQIREIYQATEGFLGISCESGQMHLNEDNYIFEKKKIDETKFYPIITDVERRSQAIIRYELDDILVEKKGPCECGRPGIILERIEGRSDQVLTFHSKSSKRSVTVYPDLFRRLLRDGSWYNWNYLITQTSEHSIAVSLDRQLTEDESNNLKKNFYSALKDQGLSDFEMEVKYIVDFPELRGKRRRIVGLSV